MGRRTQCTMWEWSEVKLNVNSLKNYKIDNFRSINYSHVDTFIVRIYFNYLPLPGHTHAHAYLPDNG